MPYASFLCFCKTQLGWQEVHSDVTENHKLCFRGWALINCCRPFTWTQEQICSLKDATPLLSWLSTRWRHTRCKQRGRAQRWKGQLAEKVMSSVGLNGGGAMCACVSCWSRGHVFMQILYPFFFFATNVSVGAWLSTMERSDNELKPH